MLLTQDVALKGYFRQRIVLGAEHLPWVRPAVPPRAMGCADAADGSGSSGH